MYMCVYMYVYMEECVCVYIYIYMYKNIFHNNDSGYILVIISL